MTEEREAELRRLLKDAHQQLYERDHELLILVERLIGTTVPATTETGGSTVFMHQLQEDVGERDRTILRLSSLLEEQSAWASRSAHDVAVRDKTIVELQAELARQMERAQRPAWLLAVSDAGIRVRAMLRRVWHW